MFKIPFSKINFGKEEKRAILDVIDSGWVVMGKKTKEFEEKFAEYVGAKYAIFVDSCTSALFLSLKYLGIGEKNYVYLPSLTFVSTAEAIVNCGATPVWVDVDRKTFLMQENNGFNLPVHLMGRKSKISAKIYDSAHRIQRMDVYGSDALWCYSFYATKNLNTIQGGMIATNDLNAYEWLKKARDHGISQGTTERYKEGKYEYSIDFIGFREKSDDIHAAIGIEQLKKLDDFNHKRDNIVSLYNTILGLNRIGNHLYPILVSDRSKFMQFMANKGIQCSVHFLPLHKMPAFQSWSQYKVDGLQIEITLPNTEYLGQRLVSLPLFPQMTDKEVIEVAQAVLDSNLFIKE